MSLASHYARFRVSDRILLTGHSHQAWPDVAFEAQQRAWLDAAEYVDDKWAHAEEVAEQVRAGWRRLLNEPRAEIALGQNTHELVTRLLSSLTHRPALVTTDGEFHTIRRQIDRLEEANVNVVRVPARPVETLTERLASTVDDRTACVLVSSVLFETAEIVPDLRVIADACAQHGAELLVDAYHHLNVVPFDVAAMGLERAFVVGGGYKYCQLGEGNCFMRIPPDCELRPLLTGWFSEFAHLAAARDGHKVQYGAGGARFAGATYDPTSHYRGAAVFRFHQDMALSATRLREISTEQTETLADAVRSLDVNPALLRLVDVPPERRGGFIAIRSPRAAEIVNGLRSRGVYADARSQTLRLGPAPYVTGDQLLAAVAELRHVADQLRRESN